MPKDQNKESWEGFENKLIEIKADYYGTVIQCSIEEIKDLFRSTLANELERVMGSLPNKRPKCKERQCDKSDIVCAVNDGFNTSLSTVKDIISKRVEEIRG